jgi:carboxymethylenebutenolidase
MQCSELAVPVPGGTMGALLCMPERVPAPGALVLLDSSESRALEVARRLAAAGFVALAPDLFYRERAPRPPGDDRERRANRLMRTVALSSAPEERVKDERTLADVRAALDVLRARPEVRSGPVGVVGLSLGGRLAFLAACRMGDEIAAAVCVCGSHIVPVVEEAIGLEAPLLMLFGGRDAEIHPREIDRIRAELGHRHKPYEVRVFDDAGHRLLELEQPQDGVASGAQAWGATLRWLERNLSGAVAGSIPRA